MSDLLAEFLLYGITYFGVLVIYLSTAFDSDRIFTKALFVTLGLYSILVSLTAYLKHILEVI